LRAIQDNRRWLLLALWEDMYRVGQWCFGSTSDTRPLSASIWEYFAVLAGVCVVGLFLIVRRVRAVEVVR
jgi:hypothetical protein